MVIFSLHQELTEELSKLKLRERDLKLASEPPLLLDIENNEMHKVFTKVNQLKIQSIWSSFKGDFKVLA